MKPRRVFWLALVLLAASGLAWAISGYVRQELILPVLEFSWLFRNYIGIIPQDWLWSLVLVLMTAIAVWNLTMTRVSLPHSWVSRQPSLPPGRELAFWLGRVRSGPYQRWLVAHQLAGLALDILRARGVQIERGDPLSGPDWNPPENIQKYLAAAMHSNPVNFAQRAKLAGLETDPEIKAVIAYLEAYMEISNES